MTVLIFFPNENIAISDVLTTYDGRGMWSYLPSTGDLSLPTSRADEYGCHPARLVRKVIPLTHAGLTVNVLIAGTVRCMRGFLACVEHLSTGSVKPCPEFVGFDRRNLQHLMEEAYRQGGYKGDEIGFILQRDGKFFTNGEDTVLPYFGRTILAGSGAESIRSWLHQKGTSFEQDLVNEAPAMRLKRFCLDLPSMLLRADRIKPSPTLANGVGGYYEVHTSDLKTLKPFNSRMTKVFGKLKSEPEKELILESLWFESYDDDYFWLLSAPCLNISLKPGDGKLVAYDKFNVQMIAPPDRIIHASKDVKELVRQIWTADIHAGQVSSDDHPGKELNFMTLPKAWPLSLTAEAKGVNIFLSKEKFENFAKFF